MCIFLRNFTNILFLYLYVTVIPILFLFILHSLWRHLCMFCVSCRREVDEFVEHREREREHLEMMKQQTSNIYQTHRLHHLLSTKQVGLQEHKCIDMNIFRPAVSSLNMESCCLPTFFQYAVVHKQGLLFFLI